MASCRGDAAQVYELGAMYVLAKGIFDVAERFHVDRTTAAHRRRQPVSLGRGQADEPAGRGDRVRHAAPSMPARSVRPATPASAFDHFIYSGDQNVPQQEQKTAGQLWDIGAVRRYTAMDEH